MLERGYIKFHRDITKWGWYRNVNTFKLFTHLLLTANYEAHSFEGVMIGRGQRVASRMTLANETGLTEREVRTALKHLETTGEVTSTGYAKFTVYSVNQYDAFVETPSDMPSGCPASDQQATKERPQCKKEQESKRKNKKRGEAAESYGEYGRVKLTQTQYRRLLAAYGEERTHAYIMQMDEWMQMKGKAPYKDFYLAIRRWIRKDAQEGKNTQQNLEERAYEQYKGTTAAEGFI